MVTHYAHALRGVWYGSDAGRAVKDAERQKELQYRHDPERGTPIVLVPLCFETGGRWGMKAIHELRRLAKVKSQMGLTRNAADKDAVYRATLLRWRREISCALQQGNAAILMAATGQRSNVVEMEAVGDCGLDLIPESH